MVSAAPRSREAPAEPAARVPSLGLLRHGIAESSGGDPGLTQAGIETVRAEALGLARIGLTFDWIACSPLRRAHQTAQLLAETLTPGSEAEVVQALAPGCRLTSIPGLLARHQRARAILLVGHQPDLGGIAAGLIGARSAFHLGRGDLCWFELDRWPSPGELDEPPSATLKMVLPATVIEALG